MLKNGCRFPPFEHIQFKFIVTWMLTIFLKCFVLVYFFFFHLEFNNECSMSIIFWYHTLIISYAPYITCAMHWMTGLLFVYSLYLCSDKYICINAISLMFVFDLNWKRKTRPSLTFRVFRFFVAAKIKRKLTVLISHIHTCLQHRNIFVSVVFFVLFFCVRI